MNHNEEMKMLTALKKIQQNTERIARALEKLADQTQKDDETHCNEDYCDIFGGDDE